MKSILISGASQRLGLYLCEAFLKSGWRVLALTRTGSEALRLLRCEALEIKELGTYTEESLRAFCDEFRATNRALDVLVNNASIYENDEGFAREGLAFYQRLQFVHMSMPALLVEGLHQNLAVAGGNILSITDIYVDNPNEDYSLYCSTKAGLQNLSMGWAKKYAPKIRVNCIQPGPIKFLAEHSEQTRQKILSQTLVGFEGGFAPIFKALQAIIDNEYLSGAVLKVDGGRSLKRG